MQIMFYFFQSVYMLFTKSELRCFPAFGFDIGIADIRCDIIDSRRTLIDGLCRAAPNRLFVFPMLLLTLAFDRETKVCIFRYN